MIAGSPDLTLRDYRTVEQAKLQLTILFGPWKAALSFRGGPYGKVEPLQMGTFDAVVKRVSRCQLD